MRKGDYSNRWLRLAELLALGVILATLLSALHWAGTSTGRHDHGPHQQDR